MRQLVSLFCSAFTIACLLPVFVSALPRSVRLMPEWQQPSSLPQKGLAPSPLNPTPAPSRPQAKGESDERRPDIARIKVICHSDYMEIQMDADLLGMGILVDVEDIRLGRSDQTGESCRAFPTEHEKYSIAAALTDCGTEHVITKDHLLYTNTLEYSPGPSSDGLIRTQPASFPIVCYYKRKFDLSSIRVMPTWLPFMSTRADEGQLAFSLHLMTDDWVSQRATTTYYLDEILNIEASVEQFNHDPMWVFVDHCVATVTPDVESVPRYDFVEQGCLMDSFLTGSSARFLPRLQHNKLQFQLESFRFHQEERTEMYISCLLRVETGTAPDGMRRACSFIDNSWQSADNEDWLCDRCVSPASNQKSSMLASQSSTGSGGTGGSSAMVHPGPRSALSSLDSTRGWEKQERVGPISVLKKAKRPLAPPEAMHGLSEPMPETNMATSVDMGPRSYSPRNDGVPWELDKPASLWFSVNKNVAVIQSPDGNVNQFFDLWKKQASQKDWTELMQLLLKASSPAVTSAETTAEALVPSEAMPLPKASSPAVTSAETTTEALVPSEGMTLPKASSPAVTSAETTTEALVPSEGMTLPLPAEEESTAAPALLPLTPGYKMADLKLDVDVAMEMHPSSPAPLKEDVVMSDNKDEDFS
ncbi:zona pellucida sperm-binding protein 3-like isoform X2 [Alosa sapidissima]|uniref:zona pellucida sperm-binding protein 3-like isoform X2 n=1 Tax=Alosa sapidissima TaxID=34773 RepID=UPI001C092469|nr:zona pellucida sperm-binding protein 3-like isoform X2 [Alosa sapidissima]